MELIDAHTHPQFASYGGDREEVINRAKNAGVKMVVVGTQFSTSAAAVELAHKYPDFVWATVGFHPAHFSAGWHHDRNEQISAEREKFEPEKLKELAADPKVVAVGECGLDYYRDKQQETRDKQIEGFLAQIELARELGKPLMIHCRSAFGDLLSTLEANGPKLRADAPGIVHFFSGTVDEAEKLLDMGFYFTFGGVITFARDYDEIIKIMPPDRILSETDAPYVAPAPYRGQRNEPAYVAEVVARLAELKNIPVAEMAGRIAANARKIFNNAL